MLMDFQMEGGQAVMAECLAPANLREQATDHVEIKPTQEVRNFELPASVWTAMFSAYAVFFIGLIIATGRDAYALFAIAISIAYAFMYFGTATILNSINSVARPKHSPLDLGQGIQTETGWMSNSAAYAQILTVPFLLAFFACAIAAIRALI